jgi:hypothetical protein
VSQAVRILHGNSAALANALAVLTAADDVHPTPNFNELGDGEAELSFISVRVDDRDDWDGAAARLQALLPTETEYFLTTED